MKANQDFHRSSFLFHRYQNRTWAEAASARSRRRRSAKKRLVSSDVATSTENHCAGLKPTPNASAAPTLPPNCIPLRSDIILLGVHSAPSDTRALRSPP